MKNKYYFKNELEIEGKLKNLSIISQFITDSMQKCSIDEKIIYHTQMVVDEACSNIIIHGYPQKLGKININYIVYLKKSSPKLIINIYDKGKKLDMDNIPEPDLNSDLENREIGGLGVFFIKRFMDDVQYSSENGKNKLKLVKFLKKS